MHAIKLKVVIDASHRLQLELPADTPTGEAEVIVLVGPDSTRRAADMPRPPPGKSLLEFLKELDRRPIRNPRSTEDIEAQIAAERVSWD